MTTPTETGTKPVVDKKEEHHSFTERVKGIFPDLRTKRQQNEDKRQLEEDLAEERKSIDEDEQRKKEVHEHQKKKD